MADTWWNDPALVAAPQAPPQNAAGSPQSPANWWADLSVQSQPAAPPQGGLAATAGDMATQAGVGLVRGTAGVAGLPGTLRDVEHGGLDWLIDRYNNNRPGSFPEIPHRIEAPAPAPGSLNDTLMRVNNAIAPPSGADVTGAIERNVTGPLPQPQTTAGRYTGAVAEFVPGMFMGTGAPQFAGGVPRLFGPRVAPPTIAPPVAVGPNASFLDTIAATLRPGNVIPNVIAPAVASETVGHALQGTPYEGAARIGAALVGGVGASRVLGPSTGERMAGAAARSFNDQDFQAANALMRDAQAPGRGVNLTADEALTYASGQSRNRMVDLRRVVDQTTGGGERMAGAMAERTPQVEGMLRQNMDAIAPPNTQPSAVGPAIQDAGEAAITRLRQGGNSIAAPYYQAAETASIPAAEYARLTASPAYQQALDQLRRDPVLNGPIAHMADNSLPVVQEAMRQLERNATGARQTMMNPQGNNRAADLMGNARTLADTEARAASPAFGQAQDIVADWQNRVMGPVRAGPVGRVAATNDVQAQARELTRPIPGSQTEAQRAARAPDARGPCSDGAACPAARRGAAQRAHGHDWPRPGRSVRRGPLCRRYSRQRAGGAEYRRVLCSEVNPQAAAEF
jgi:hypothetical protein